MCGLECLENEECRYDKENCEYKCLALSPKIKIWSSIGAVAGALILGLLIFFVVRHFRNKVHLKNTINGEKQLDYEVPYQYTMDDGMENEETYEAYQSAEYETYDGMYEEYDKNNRR